MEIEVYLGGEDKGVYFFNGKRINKNEVMFMELGICYVYNIYGMYCCMNIFSEGKWIIYICNIVLVDMVFFLRYKWYLGEGKKIW